MSSANTLYLLRVRITSIIELEMNEIANEVAEHKQVGNYFSSLSSHYLMWMQALKMLRRKVHPQEMTEKQFVKMQKSEKKDIPHEDAYRIGGDDENKMVGQAASNKSEKNTRKLSSNGICKGASTINGGHWIKTDSDCKLQ